jgi:tRNA(Phe) wybutosine-synthesizing methylase Tyw3
MVESTPEIGLTPDKVEQQTGFQQRKQNCLSKRDKSSAGRIDPRAVQICHSINELKNYYTLSSCAGRCFLYRGKGIKSTSDFERYRVNHDLIREPQRYFTLQTLPPLNWADSDRSDIKDELYDLTGGGDATPTRGVGQYDNKQRLLEEKNSINDLLEDHDPDVAEMMQTSQAASDSSTNEPSGKEIADLTLWLRFEPFILHVCCRTLPAAQALLNDARPVFKNVGLTSWKDAKQKNNNNSKYVVAIWGDEGLDMPLTTPKDPNSLVYEGQEEWLAGLVNSRHQRNWEKIDKVNAAVLESRTISDEESNMELDFGWCESDAQVPLANSLAAKKGFDMIGDVAMLHSLPEGSTQHEWGLLGEAIMAKNKAIKVR